MVGMLCNSCKILKKRIWPILSGFFLNAAYPALGPDINSGKKEKVLLNSLYEKNVLASVLSMEQFF